MFLKGQVAYKVGNLVVLVMRNVLVMCRPVLCLVLIIKQLTAVSFVEPGTVLDFMFRFSVS